MSQNPYQAPQGPQYFPEGAPSDKMPSGKEPLSHQAAKFSLYAPFIVLLVSCCVRPGFENDQPPNVAMQTGTVMFVLIAVTSTLGMVFGVVGVVGGIRRQAVSTIIYAIIGLALNGLFFAMLVSLVMRIIELRR